MIPDSIPVFLNGQPVTVRADAVLTDLVGAVDADLAAALVAGAARATDGRGIDARPDTPLVAGAIFRVFRSARSGPPADA